MNKAVKIDSWETREDLAAFARVAEVKKNPARLKACREAIANHQAVMGENIQPADIKAGKAQGSKTGAAVAEPC